MNEELNENSSSNLQNILAFHDTSSPFAANVHLEIPCSQSSTTTLRNHGDLSQ